MSNFIHKTATVDNTVKLGIENYIGPYCFITGDTVIGDNNRFEGYCSVGTPPEHREYFNFKNGKTIIGNNNTFREFITINAGIVESTTLEDNVVMLRNSYIGHDSTVESNVTLACNVLIGGHSHIMVGANFGLASVCHQFSKIGAYSMIGMNSTVPKNTKVLPGYIYVGSPIRLLKKNTVGLLRNNVTDFDLENLLKAYNND